MALAHHSRRLPALALLVASVLLFGCNGAASVEERAAPEVSSTALSFTDVTAAAGLTDFRHRTGAMGEKWFPEAMGAGCGFVDYDADGWPDLLVAGGGTWDSTDTSTRALWLYRNNHDGTFTDVTEETGLNEVAGYTFGIAAADYDNDGDEDVFVTTLGRNLLLRNDGGRFEEVALAAGLGDEAEWSTSALFFDADRDGDADLYVGSYVSWTPETDIWCSLDGETKGYCTPENYIGIPSRYYENTGDGRFRDRTEEAGFIPAPGKMLGVVEIDYNRDGWPDLYVASDTQPDLLYLNNGDGTFTERGAYSGVAYDENGIARAGMGVDAGVVDSTGEETLFVGNFSKEMIGVYRHIGNGLFVDRAGISKIGRPSLLTLTFGLFLFDVDLDADLDLFAANGHVQPDIEQTQEGIGYEEAPHLFINQGGGAFVDVAPDIGEPFTKELVARGAAWGDYDRDGDLDILISENGGGLHLWRNDVLPAADVHYLRVELEGRQSHLEGLGAEVEIVAAGRRQHRRIRTGSSFQSQSEKAAVFGLGRASSVDSLVVRWPGGSESRFANVAADQTVRVQEGAGTLVPQAEAVAVR